ncbi:MAG: hypothetical protein HWN67_11255 [Candidatus Helarchaeota archaeon]|nr:hypothetical protein [Candidatus Helarchaeota archaeon]
MEIGSQIPEKLHIERSVFEQFIDHTFRFSDYEWGGLLIGREMNGELHCIAAVLPPQKTQSSGYCEFRREIFQVIRNALDDIEEKFNDENFNIITWIHTHPNLGVFLSPTDQETYTYLSKLNPSLSAIVVDPVQYELLAVNSKPGNISGFTSFTPNLNYLHNFKESNQSLIDKLKLFQQSINTEKNRKLYKLDESENIEAFIPIPIALLKDKLIMSSLMDLKINLEKINKNIFRNKENIEVKVPTEEDTEIKNLIEYLSHFRAFKQQFKSWNRYSMDIKLYERDLLSLNQFHPSFPLKITIKNLNTIGFVLKSTPVLQISLWDKYLQFSNVNFSKKIKWSSIEKMGIDDLSKTAYYHVISYKTGLFSRWKRLLIFDPYFESLKRVLKRKVALSFNENKKLRKKFEKLMRESEKEAKKQEERLEKEVKKQEERLEKEVKKQEERLKKELKEKNKSKTKMKEIKNNINYEKKSSNNFVEDEKN